MLKLTIFILLVVLIPLCLSCNDNNDCDGHKICLATTCKFCKKNDDCKTAAPNRPYCRTADVNSCKQCLKNDHCPDPTQSRCSDYRCEPCQVQEDCTHIYGGKKMCSGGICVECIEDSDCTGGGTCNPLSQCEGSVCNIGPIRCSTTSTLPFCQSNICKSCGVNPSFCTGLGGGKVCSPDGSCRQCWNHEGCQNVALSQCSSGSCMICSDHTHCAHIYGKTKCSGSAIGCVQCTDPSHCGPGYSCTSNACVVSGSPLVVRLLYTNVANDYMIDFPPELVVNTNVTAGIKIELENIGSLKYTYILTKVTDTQYKIHFEVKETIPITQLQLLYTYLGPENEASVEIPDWQAQIPTKQMSFIKPTPTSEAIQVMKDIGEIASLVAVGGTGSVFTFGGNPAVIWALINLIQSFYYLIFVNVNYPINVAFFLQVFSIADFDFIPNPISYFWPEIKEETLPTPARFTEYKVNGLFLDNAGNMLLIWAIVFMVYGVALLVSKYLKKFSKILNLIALKVVSWFEWSGVLRALITSYPELAQASFLQIRAINFDTGLYSTSSMCGILFSIHSFVFPILTFMLVKKSINDQLKLDTKYGALIEEYSCRRDFTKYFCSIMLIKRLLLNLILVFVHDYPYVEIFLLTALSLSSLILIIIYRPYPSRIDNYTKIITELLFTVLHVLILLLIHDDHTLNYNEETRLDMGWALVGTSTVIILIDLGTIFVELIKSLRKLYYLFKRFLKKRVLKKNEKAVGKAVANTNTAHDFSVSEMNTSIVSETPIISNAYLEKKSVVKKRSNINDGLRGLKLASFRSNNVPTKHHFEN